MTALAISSLTEYANMSDAVSAFVEGST